MALGILGGAALGGIGSGIQAAEARKAQSRFRRRQRKALADTREFTGGTTVSTGKGFFGDPGSEFAPGSVVTDDMLEQGLPKGTATFIDPATGERKLGGRVDEILADPLLVSARNFLQGTFDNAADSPLARDFAKGIAAAQASRGTFFGGAAVSAEAGGLAAFSQRLRQDLLPSTIQFATLGEQLRQSVMGFEAPLRVAAATGGSGLGDSSNMNAPGVFGAALTGALSGAAGGFALDQQFGLTSGLFGGNQIQSGFIPGTVTGSGGTRSTGALIGDSTIPQDQLLAAIELLSRQGRI